MPRIYERKFDWDEARQLYAEGHQIKAIAAKLGVSTQAVRRVVIPQVAQKMAEYSAKWQKTAHRCIDCGTSMSYGGLRCRPCANKALTQTVHETELRCVLCKQWKPDDQFGNSAQFAHRRHHRRSCRACDGAARKTWRERNRERENAYQREYKKKRRSSAKSKEV